MVIRSSVTFSAVVLVAIGGLVVCLGVAAEFTEKRLKKAPSMSNLKESCCEQCGEVLKIVPSLLHAVATVQSEAVLVIQGYWEGDKKGWCEQASREKLQQCEEHMRSLQTKISAVTQ